MSCCNQTQPIPVTAMNATVRIGVWDTFNVECQQFDISPWVNAFGPGQLMVLVLRPGEDIPYAAHDVAVDGGTATWTFDAVDTDIPGIGSCALCYIVGEERRAKTIPFTTFVAPTLGPAGETPPDPLERWYDDILDAAAKAERSAQAAEESEDAAKASEEAAQGYAESASDSADAALESERSAAESANNAAESAHDAQTALEGMVYVTFAVDADGHVLIRNGDLLGTTSFELVQVGDPNGGHLEVTL